MIELLVALITGWAPIIIMMCTLILLMVITPEKNND